MSDKKTIVTPEQVVLSYNIAGMGYRFAAALVDTLLQSLMIAAVVIAFALLLPAVALVPEGGFWPILLAAILALLLFGIFWGYYIYFETRWNGQTPGKRRMGLRVIRDTGHPVDFRAVLIRNLVRIIDFLPGWYAVGAFSIFASRESKRLGDFAAGTIVIREERAQQRQAQAEPVQPSAAQPTPAAEPALAAETGLPLDERALDFSISARRLSRDDYLAVQQFLRRAGELAGDVRAHLARQMAEPLMRKMALPVPEDPAFSYEGFLRDVAAAYLRAAGR